MFRAIILALFALPAHAADPEPITAGELLDLCVPAEKAPLCEGFLAGFYAALTADPELMAGCRAVRSPTREETVAELRRPLSEAHRPAHWYLEPLVRRVSSCR